MSVSLTAAGRINKWRGIAILLTQLPLILFLGAKYDLIFGFNRMDSGFTFLLFLFVLVPLINLAWLITEIILSIKRFRQQNKAVSFLMPCMALFFFVQALAIDFYILAHARM
ncbi:MAG: hypothetical protein JRE72_14125 [Deltaproteobacteria bacterium]|jgi:hypothetical protein|nr:hypothetical protein [Deltaproteobacteria bacterium]